MARFHVNPATGEAGLCRAHNGKCPFGGADAHHDSIEAARSSYETQAEASYNGGSLKRESAPAGRLFGNSETRAFVGSVIGKDYSSMISDAKARAAFAKDAFSKPRTADLASSSRPASSNVASAAREAISARKTARATIATKNATPAVASSASAALAARRASGNSFLNGARSMASVD